VSADRFRIAPTDPAQDLRYAEQAHGHRHEVEPSRQPDHHAVIGKLSEAMRAVIGSAEFRERLVEFGMRPVASTPPEFDRFLETEVERWSRIAREAGIRIAD
jgi:hypothetical protein